MQKIIGVTELQRKFRRVFDEVTRDHMPYVLTRGSRPEAAIIPYDEFTRYQAWKEQEVVAEFDRAMQRVAERNVSYSDAEVAADVDAAVAEVRTTPTSESCCRHQCPGPRRHQAARQRWPGTDPAAPA